MVSKLTRNEFQQSLQGKNIKVADAAADSRLTGVDVARADLNRDGKIAGADETAALFKVVDAYDRNGDAASIAATDANNVQTRAGAVATALVSRSVFDVAEPTPLANFADAALKNAFKGQNSVPLSRSMNDDRTYAVQYALARLGVAVGTVDGKFGPGTERAVKAFQTSAGLPATGSVDLATLHALDGKLKSTELRTPAEVSGRPLEYLAAQAVALPKLAPIADRSKPVDWNHPEVQKQYGEFVAAHWEQLKTNRVESDCKTLSLFLMDQFRTKVKADLGVQLPLPATLPAKEWSASTGSNNAAGYFSRFESLRTVRPGYENAQVLQRLDPNASMQAGTNLRYAGVDANMASRALRVSSPYVATADNAGDTSKPEIPVQNLTPGDVIFMDHTGDGRVDHMANVIKVERDEAGKVTRLVVATGSYDDMKDASGATAPNHLGEVNNYTEEVSIDLDATGRVKDSRVTWSSEPSWLVAGRYSARTLLMEMKPGGTISVGRWAQPRS
ncbi:MAG: peptidoglycan-binding domain-containing protein [Archangium sp.]